MEEAELEFEWDEAKSERTQQERGISFEDAALIFLDAATIIMTARSNPDEVRYMAVGKSSEDLLVTVVNTWRIYGVRKVRRIISARKSSKAERLRYQSLQQLPAG